MGFRFVYRPPSFRAWFQKIRRGRGIVGAPPTVIPPIGVDERGANIRILNSSAVVKARRLTDSAVVKARRLTDSATVSSSLKVSHV